eukprot:917884-Prorocentrum_minimum.AAC.1
MDSRLVAKIDRRLPIAPQKVHLTGTRWAPALRPSSRRSSPERIAPYTPQRAQHDLRASHLRVCGSATRPKSVASA